MKKQLSIIVLILLTALTLCLIACTDNSSHEQFSVAYKAGEGGYIKGNEYQTVAQGEDSKAITAVPFDGYRFAKWSDNDSTEPQRAEIDVQNTVEAVAEFSKEILSVKYRPHIGSQYETRDDWAQNGGYIEGVQRQDVIYGEDATPVIAKPYAGFVFADWSDGSTNPERQDKKLTSDLTVSVRFVKTTQVFTYEYDGATDNNTEESIALSWNRLRETIFVVPEKEGYNFQGWFLDEELTRKMSNRMGQSLMGNEMLLNNEGKLYSKWISEDILVYPILMIFVTETQATLTSNYKRSETNINEIYDLGIEYEVDVYHKMSELERKVCELIPSKLAECLNEMLEGIVAFEVDTYFTTEAVGANCLWAETGYMLTRSYSIVAYDIPEVAPLLSYYRSVMTTFGMNDYNMLLHYEGGSADMKYASCFLETVFDASISTGISLETLYDWLSDKNNALYNQQWEGLMEHYVHEFTHTVESLHKDIYEYHRIQNGLEFDKQYLRYEYIVDGKPVGIPYSLWTGEGLDIWVVYTADFDIHREDMGTLICLDASYYNFQGFVEKRIPFGGTTAEITAVPNDGFRFVKWSDGVTTPTRQDTNVTSYLRVTAIFEKV